MDKQAPSPLRMPAGSRSLRGAVYGHPIFRFYLKGAYACKCKRVARDKSKGC